MFALAMLYLSWLSAVEKPDKIIDRRAPSTIIDRARYEQFRSVSLSYPDNAMPVINDAAGLLRFFARIPGRSEGDRRLGESGYIGE